MSAQATFVQKTTEWIRKPKSIDANLKDYFKTYKTFRWSQVEKEFDWHKTKKVNIIHEMIDRHAAGVRKNKVALYFWDPTPSTEYPKGRDEKYTFLDLKRESSKFGNVLKKIGGQKKEHMAVFLPRTPELYIAILGMHRIGAIPVPLFEAFMETAVQDRMADSEAEVMVTNAELLKRVPFEKLPLLKKIILVGELDRNKITAPNTVDIYQYEEEMGLASDRLEPTWLKKDDGLVIHYTSGSTGKSKGALHRQYAMVVIIKPPNGCSTCGMKTCIGAPLTRGG